MISGVRIDTEITTFFKSYDKAFEIAEANNKTDDEWSYRVERTGDKFIVIITDEDGDDIGTF